MTSCLGVLCATGGSPPLLGLEALALALTIVAAEGAGRCCPGHGLVGHSHTLLGCRRPAVCRRLLLRGRAGPKT